ncbi:MAG: GAF domain-containing sensor histidine kinase [Chloroflexota bacterium]
MNRKYTQSIDWLLCHLRWPWLILAALITLITASATEALNPNLPYLLVGAGIFYNIVVVILLFSGWYPRWVAISVAIADIGLATLLMWFTGAYQSGQMPVMILVVVGIALRFRPEFGLLAATPMVLTLGAAVAIDSPLPSNMLVNVAVQALTLFVAAGTAGYIGRQLLRGETKSNQDEIDNLRAANDRARAIYDMANSVNSSLNYGDVLKKTVDQAYMALADADNPNLGEGVLRPEHGAVGMVLLFDSDGKRTDLKMVAGRNTPKIDVGRTVSAETGVLSEIIYRAEAVVVSDLQTDEGLNRFSSLQACNSMVCAPLRAGFDTWGLVLIASPRVGCYTATHASFLATFCKQAIFALQNAQLYEDLEMEQKKLLEKEAQTRRELARDLHDGPTQDVAGIAMRLDFVHKLLKKDRNVEKSIEEISKLEDVARKTTQGLRTTLFTLRPVVLETQGLEAALDQYAERLRDLENLNIEVENHGYDAHLPTEKEGVIFTIVEEAIGNAKKHAKADKMNVKLGVQNNAVIAEIVDNGQGFDVAAVEATYDQRGSLGLINMRERAQMIGGYCHFHSAVGQGTSIRIQVPINGNGRI